MLIKTEKTNLYVSRPAVMLAKIFARHYGHITRGKSYSEQWLFKAIAQRDTAKASDWEDLPFVVIHITGGKKLFCTKDSINKDPKKLVEPVKLAGLMTLAEAGYRWYEGNDANIRQIMRNKPESEWNFEIIDLAKTKFARG